MLVGLMAMVRNEQRLIAEFMAHHIGLGIERLHLFDNGSQDATRAIIEQAGRAYPGITVEDWRGSHVDAFERGLEVMRPEVEWLFAGDCDEFIVSPAGNDLIEFLTFMGAHAAIGLHWAIFGSSGLIGDPGDLFTASFLHRAPDDFGPNRHIKSLVRPRLVQKVWNSHTFVLDPQYFPYMNCRAEALHWAEGTWGLAANQPVLSPFRVNHYFCRNRDARNAKMANAAHGAETGFFLRSENDWLSHDRNDVRDPSALRYAGQTRRIMARMGFQSPSHSVKASGSTEPGASAASSRLIYVPPKPREAPIRILNATQDSPPIIHISTMGNLANQMIQFMAAKTLAARVSNSVISNVNLPVWNILAPDRRSGDKKILVVEGHRLDFDHLAGLLLRREVDIVDIRSYAQCLDNFLEPGFYNQVFRCPDPEVVGRGEDELLCNIRGGDILDGHHKDYTQLPVEFYEDLVQETKLRPVFMGQIGDNAYIASLRQRFPQAPFIESAGPLRDFEIIRRSRFIVPSISTFSWLAAWLSDAKQIFMPVSGTFHPLQSPTTHLLPLSDPRYRFYLFPFNYAVPIEDFRRAHTPLLGTWRLMHPAMLADLLTRAPRFPVDKAKYVALFDEAFYLDHYGDIKQSVAAGDLPSGYVHYVNYGIQEGREPCFVDVVHYTTQYRLAALELGQGDFKDPLHHYLEIGRERGYTLRPES